MEIIKYQANLNLDLFERAIKILYPNDEYEIISITAKWSWKYFKNIPCAKIIERDTPISKLVADKIIKLLLEEKSVWIPNNKNSLKVLSHVFDSIVPHVEYDGSGILLNPKI